MHFSLRATLGLTIIVMGLLAVVLALTTGEVYRDLAVAKQRTALSDLVGLKTRDLLHELEGRSRDVGLQLQHDPAFRKAFDAANTAQLQEQLNNQFNQYFVTAGVLKLARLDARDIDFRLVATSTDGDSGLLGAAAVCPGLIESARARVGADRLKVTSELCLYQGQSYQSVIVPIGGLRPRGYLEIITDPTHSLRPVETALSMPLQILRANGDLVYQSSAWPQSDALSSMLVASHELTTASDKPAIVVAVASDMHGLHEDLQATRAGVVLVAGVAIVIAVLLALWVLQRSALGPLNALKHHMLLLRRDRARLGEPVVVAGNNEISQLADGFNELGSELKNLYQTLEHMAYTDSLTELPNRARFQESLEALTHTAMPFALLLIDLDRFKEVNDSFGHDVGDQLLKEIGSRLKRVLRRSDVLVRLDSQELSTMPHEGLARLGGDEFAAVLAGVDNAVNAVGVAEKLTKAMEAPFVIKGHSLLMRMSLGIALYPEHGSDPMMMLQQADMAMYHAKQQQCGYALADNTRYGESLARATLERDLRDAIFNDGLELHFQPKINVRAASVCGVEALLRWRHPQQGNIPPDRFIPIAEQAGLMSELTRWVLNRGLEQCARWNKAGHAIGISINISATNLRDPQLVTYVMASLQKWNVPATALTLELTESAVMGDADHALEVLTRLDAMGVRLSIDDFGTGYSSLSYLKRLPVDEIKIDRSFVMDMKADSNDAIIVRSTVDLAHNMGLRVVAEGVENTEALEYLRILGCDMAQGYFISRPVPYEDFMVWLTKTKTCARHCEDPSRDQLSHPFCP